MWCIAPEQDAAFVCQMEQVLEVYKRPYNPQYPVICMDEQPKQLIRETRSPQPPESGKPERFDYEYKREGVCTVWMFVEALGRWREARVTERRTAVDWAYQVKQLVDAERYQKAEILTLVCDNLNTHTPASFYQAFEATEAFRLTNKVHLLHTPKHGSWLNIAEQELSVLTRQCLGCRIEERSKVEQEATQWAKDRNQRQIGVNWHFTTHDARIKLKHLYPKVQE